MDSPEFYGLRRRVVLITLQCAGAKSSRLRRALSFRGGVPVPLGRLQHPHPGLCALQVIIILIIILIILPPRSPGKRGALRRQLMSTLATTSTSRTAASTRRSWAARTRGRTTRIRDTWTQSPPGSTMTSTARSSARSSKTLSVALLPFMLQLLNASYQVGLIS